ncbi:MAG: TlpA family protein disulfide reductase [Candidatus Krumholzibacteriia bacterium]
MYRKSVWIVVVAVFVLSLASVAALTAPQSCAKGSCGHTACAEAAGVSTKAASLDDYSADELKVIKYIADQIVATGATSFEDEDLAKATGLSVEVIAAMDGDHIQAGVMAELANRNFDLAKLMNNESCAGNCAAFGACSVDKNLAGASGAELEKYSAEKKTDGQEFTKWKAPEFTLPTTTGGEISLADFSGKPVALILMSTHCNHCADTAPMLSELQKKYENDLAIVPVMVGARSVKSVSAWARAMKVEYPILVAEGKDLARAYEARLVPSVFLIDSKGYVTKKFVGFKDKTVLDQGLESFSTASR